MLVEVASGVELARDFSFGGNGTRTIPDSRTPPSLAVPERIGCRLYVCFSLVELIVEEAPVARPSLPVPGGH